MSELKLTRYGEGFQNGVLFGKERSALEIEIIIRNNLKLKDLRYELYKWINERKDDYYGHNN